MAKTGRPFSARRSRFLPVLALAFLPWPLSEIESAEFIPLGTETFAEGVSGDSASSAFAVSGDGSVVVGFSDNGSPCGQTAFIWDESHGMRRVVDALTDAGLDVNGWTLTWATSVSDDGNVLVGRGWNPWGQEEAWMARLTPVPEPSFSSFLPTVFIAFALVYRRCTANRNAGNKQETSPC